MAPYSPQSNNVDEHKIRTPNEMMNAMLINSGLTQNLREETIISANHILKNISYKSKVKTLYELLKGRKSYYKYFNCGVFSQSAKI